ncbi:hypothetical protein AgCh_010236 [Apium graveolens]
MLTSSEELIKNFEKLEIEVQIPELRSESMYAMSFQLEILEKIRCCHEQVMNHEKDKLTGEEVRAQKDEKGIYHVNSRSWIPNIVELKHEILHEAHNSRFSIHPGSTKIYHASIGMPPYEALYGRKYRSPTYWNEVGERKLIGPELVQQMKEKVEVIRKWLIVAQDRQKKYANQDQKDMQFELGDKVLLKISPWKRLSRFGKKGKLSPRGFKVGNSRIGGTTVKPPQPVNRWSSFPNPEIKGVTYIIRLELLLHLQVKKPLMMMILLERFSIGPL